ncbi:MAG: lysylphosphatidylglycerol synthase domain-containing protein, partial [Bacteroidota bacterium]
LLSGTSVGYLLFVVVLMPLNWFLEALKWRVFIPKDRRMKLSATMAAIFSGVTFSLFTPNRTGDYLGRILLVKAEDNWSVFSATLAGNLCQLSVLLLGGWCGLLYYTQSVLEISWQDYKVFLMLALMGTIIVVICLVNIQRLLTWLLKWPFLEKFKDSLAKYLDLFRSYSRLILWKGLFWAGLRYFVYTQQYLLMLYFAGIEVNYIIGLAGIATLFFVQSSIPLPPALGLLARGEIALVVWGPFSDEPLRILAASFGLFIINLTVPALLGLVAILRVNILKSLGYEKTKR